MDGSGARHPGETVKVEVLGQKRQIGRIIDLVEAAPDRAFRPASTIASGSAAAVNGSTSPIQDSSGESEHW
jgi:hypothetical protein